MARSLCKNHQTIVENFYQNNYKFSKNNFMGQVLPRKQQKKTCSVDFKVKKLAVGNKVTYQRRNLMKIFSSNNLSSWLESKIFQVLCQHYALQFSSNNGQLVCFVNTSKFSLNQSNNSPESTSGGLQIHFRKKQWPSPLFLNRSCTPRFSIYEHLLVSKRL